MRFRKTLLFSLAVLAVAGGVRADECDPNDPTLIKPDLVNMVPTRARTFQRGSGRRVVFDTKVGNVGQGPFIMKSNTVDSPSGPVTRAVQEVWRTDGTNCEHVAGYFEFHASHNHWHVNDFNSFELRKDDPVNGELVAKSDKISFCLLDIQPMRGWPGQRQVYGNCTSQETTQGISSGWMDIYENYLDDQWIMLDPPFTSAPVPAGTYYLVNSVDPDNLFIEVDDSREGNMAYTTVSVPALIGAPASGGGTPSPTVNPPPPTPTPTTGRPGRPVRPVRPPRPPRPTRPPRP